MSSPRVARSRAARSISVALLVIAGGCFLAIVLLAVRVARSGTPMSAGSPLPFLFTGLAALVMRHVLATGLPRGARGWAGLAANVVLLLVALCASLLAAEALFRRHLRNLTERNTLAGLAPHARQADIEGAAFGNRHALARIVRASANARLIYELRPNLNVEFGPVVVRTNGAGMRDSREYMLARPPDRVRIVGVGDSGMFGWDVAQDEDYLSVLERRLDRREGPVTYDVLNLAVPGYNTHQEVEMVRWRGLGYEPSVVVVGWCANDTELPMFVHGEPTFDRWDTSYLYSFVFDRARFARILAPDVRDLPRLLLEHRLGRTPPRDIDPRLADPRIVAGTGLAGVERALSELRELADEHRFRALVFGPMDDAIEAICARAGLACLNTLAEIPAARHPGARVHSMHPTAAGHGVLAEHLEHALDRLGWLGP